MQHRPDNFKFDGNVIEIVQGNEKDNYEVRKEIFVNPVTPENFSVYLHKLQMLAADMLIKEKYTARSGEIEMTGYSVHTEYLDDGKFLGKITLYTEREDTETAS